MERLEPLEKLEKDYYLDEQSGGWFSDGENRDSESSDDEMREEISKLAGVRRCQGPSSEGTSKTGRRKDEFESDMDDELDEQLVAHAAQFMQASSKKGDTETTEKPDDTPPPLERASDGHSAMDEAESGERPSGSKMSPPGTPTPQEASSSSGIMRDSKKKIKKSVSFKEPQIVSEPILQPSSAFDHADNLLRKAANKAVAKHGQEPEVEFYDADEDDDNERWVQEHRKKLGLSSREHGRDKRSGISDEPKDIMEKDTDAVLSCPACMTLLSRQCQRHDIYHDQYRAMFVENCKVVMDESLFMPESGRKKQRRLSQKTVSQPKPNTIVSANEATALRREDIFHPVQCAVCSTAVGVLDFNEIYHFFNVLTGYVLMRLDVSAEGGLGSVRV